MSLQKERVGGLDVLKIRGDPDGVTILLLHGYGADASDLASLHSFYQATPQPTWIFPNGPLKIPFSPAYVGRAWFPIDMAKLQQAMYEEDVQAILHFFQTDLEEARAPLAELIERLEIPRSKLILGGFSQGAILAIDTALHHHDPTAALLIFSGTIANFATWSHLAPLHARTRFFQSHGVYDPILPFSLAQSLEILLKNGHLEGKLHTFQGGHEIPRSILTQAGHFLKGILQ
jgi:phospholipase/carboxylesterase